VDFSVINNGCEPITKTFRAYLHVDGTSKSKQYDSNLSVNAQASVTDYSAGKSPVRANTIKVVLYAANAIDMITRSDSTFTRSIPVFYRVQPIHQPHALA